MSAVWHPHVPLTTDASGEIPPPRAPAPVPRPNALPTGVAGTALPPFRVHTRRTRFVL